MSDLETIKATEPIKFLGKETFRTADGTLIFKDGLLMRVRENLGYTLDLEKIETRS